MTDFPVLSDLQKDALKEVGNIGAGHAATALSQLLHQKVTLSEPSFDLIRFDECASVFDPNQQVVALRMHVRGGVQGQMVVFFDYEQSSTFASTFLKRIVGDITIFDSMKDSTLMEFANIIGGSYLTALITLTGVDMRPSVPTLHYGTVSGTLAALGDINPESPVMFIQSSFGGEEMVKSHEIFGRVMFIPGEGAISKLLEPFGM